MPSDQDLQRYNHMRGDIRNMKPVEGVNAEIINAMRECLVYLTIAHDDMRKAYLSLRDVILQAEVD